MLRYMDRFRQDTEQRYTEFNPSTYHLEQCRNTYGYESADDASLTDAVPHRCRHKDRDSATVDLAVGRGMFNSLQQVYKSGISREEFTNAPHEAAHRSFCTSIARDNGRALGEKDALVLVPRKTWVSADNNDQCYLTGDSTSASNCNRYIDITGSSNHDRQNGIGSWDRHADLNDDFTNIDRGFDKNDILNKSYREKRRLRTNSFDWNRPTSLNMQHTANNKSPDNKMFNLTGTNKISNICGVGSLNHTSVFRSVENKDTFSLDRPHISQNQYQFEDVNRSAFHSDTAGYRPRVITDRPVPRATRYTPPSIPHKYRRIPPYQRRYASADRYRVTIKTNGWRNQPSTSYRSWNPSVLSGLRPQTIFPYARSKSCDVRSRSDFLTQSALSNSTAPCRRYRPGIGRYPHHVKQEVDPTQLLDEHTTAGKSETFSVSVSKSARVRETATLFESKSKHANEEAVVTERKTFQYEKRGSKTPEAIGADSKATDLLHSGRSKGTTNEPLQVVGATEGSSVDPDYRSYMRRSRAASMRPDPTQQSPDLKFVEANDDVQRASMKSSVRRSSLASALLASQKEENRGSRGASFQHTGSRWLLAELRKTEYEETIPSTVPLQQSWSRQRRDSAWRGAQDERASLAQPNKEATIVQGGKVAAAVGVKKEAFLAQSRAQDSRAYLKKEASRVQHKKEASTAQREREASIGEPESQRHTTTPSSSRLAPSPQATHRAWSSARDGFKLPGSKRHLAAPCTVAMLCDRSTSVSLGPRRRRSACSSRSSPSLRVASGSTHDWRCTRDCRAHDAICRGPCSAGRSPTPPTTATVEKPEPEKPAPEKPKAEKPEDTSEIRVMAQMNQPVEETTNVMVLANFLAMPHFSSSSGGSTCVDTGKSSPRHPGQSGLSRSWRSRSYSAERHFISSRFRFPTRKRGSCRPCMKTARRERNTTPCVDGSQRRHIRGSDFEVKSWGDDRCVVPRFKIVSKDRATLHRKESEKKGRPEIATKQKSQEPMVKKAGKSGSQNGQSLKVETKDRPERGTKQRSQEPVIKKAGKRGHQSEPLLKAGEKCKTQGKRESRKMASFLEWLLSLGRSQPKERVCRMRNFYSEKKANQMKLKRTHGAIGKDQKGGKCIGRVQEHCKVPREISAKRQMTLQRKASATQSQTRMGARMVDNFETPGCKTTCRKRPDSKWSVSETLLESMKSIAGLVINQNNMQQTTALKENGEQTNSERSAHFAPHTLLGKMGKLEIKTEEERGTKINTTLNIHNLQGTGKMPPLDLCVQRRKTAEEGTNVQKDRLANKVRTTKTDKRAETRRGINMEEMKKIYRDDPGKSATREEAKPGRRDEMSLKIKRLTHHKKGTSFKIEYALEVENSLTSDGSIWRNTQSVYEGMMPPGIAQQGDGTLPQLTQQEPDHHGKPAASIAEERVQQSTDAAFSSAKDLEPPCVKESDDQSSRGVIPGAFNWLRLADMQPVDTNLVRHLQDVTDQNRAFKFCAPKRTDIYIPTESYPSWPCPEKDNSEPSTLRSDTEQERSSCEFQELNDREQQRQAGEATADDITPNPCEATVAAMPEVGAQSFRAELVHASGRGSPSAVQGALPVSSCSYNHTNRCVHFECGVSARSSVMYFSAQSPPSFCRHVSVADSCGVDVLTNGVRTQVEALSNGLGTRSKKDDVDALGSGVGAQERRHYVDALHGWLGTRQRRYDVEIFGGEVGTQGMQDYADVLGDGTVAKMELLSDGSGPQEKQNQRRSTGNKETTLHVAAWVDKSNFRTPEVRELDENGLTVKDVDRDKLGSGSQGKDERGACMQKTCRPVEDRRSIDSLDKDSICGSTSSRCKQGAGSLGAGSLGADAIGTEAPEEDKPPSVKLVEDAPGLDKSADDTPMVDKIKKRPLAQTEEVKRAKGSRVDAESYPDSTDEDGTESDVEGRQDPHVGVKSLVADFGTKGTSVDPPQNRRHSRAKKSFVVEEGPDESSSPEEVADPSVGLAEKTQVHFDGDSRATLQLSSQRRSRRKSSRSSRGSPSQQSHGSGVFSPIKALIDRLMSNSIDDRKLSVPGSKRQSQRLASFNSSVKLNTPRASAGSSLRSERPGMQKSPPARRSTKITSGQSTGAAPSRTSSIDSASSHTLSQNVEAQTVRKSSVKRNPKKKSRKKAAPVVESGQSRRNQFVRGRPYQHRGKLRTLFNRSRKASRQSMIVLDSTRIHTGKAVADIDRTLPTHISPEKALGRKDPTAPMPDEKPRDSGKPAELVAERVLGTQLFKDAVEKKLQESAPVAAGGAITAAEQLPSVGKVHALKITGVKSSSNIRKGEDQAVDAALAAAKQGGRTSKDRAPVKRPTPPTQQALEPRGGSAEVGDHTVKAGSGPVKPGPTEDRTSTDKTVTGTKTAEVATQVKPTKLLYRSPYECPLKLNIDMKKAFKTRRKRWAPDRALMEVKTQRELALTYSRKVYDGSLVEAVAERLRREALRSAVKQEDNHKSSISSYTKTVS